MWLRNTESEIFDQAYFILSDAAYERLLFLIIEYREAAGGYDGAVNKPRERALVIPALNDDGQRDF